VHKPERKAPSAPEEVPDPAAPGEGKHLGGAALRDTLLVDEAADQSERSEGGAREREARAGAEKEDFVDPLKRMAALRRAKRARPASSMDHLDQMLTVPLVRDGETASEALAFIRGTADTLDGNLSTEPMGQPGLVEALHEDSVTSVRGPAGGDEAPDDSQQEAPDDSQQEPTALLQLIDPELYKIEHAIGEGGIGRVSWARDLRLGRQVAIKELQRRDRESRLRFLREVLITSRLQHPAIVPIYEAGRWPSGDLFYAMKLVEGTTLAQALESTPDHQQRMGLLPHVIAAAEAVAYAHERGVIHRDLKPDNILIGSYGETVVIDWGLAKELARRPEEDRVHISLKQFTQLTRLGTVMGTPDYMSPEQAAGAPSDERADVYSLGAILYELLAGVCPYQGPNQAIILTHIAAGPPLPVGLRREGIPPELCAVVDKAMARRPADRYANAGKMVADLRRFATGKLAGAHDYRTRERLWRPLTVALIAAAVVALVLACYFLAR